jgi:hypothetical protein
MIALKIIIALDCIIVCFLITLYFSMFPKPKDITEKIGLWIGAAIYYVFFIGLGILVLFT